MMRSTGLVLRLARRNLLRRPGQAVLLLVTLTVATFTLGTALAMQGLSGAGWKRLWRLATDGPHVTFISFQTTGSPGDAQLRGFGAAVRDGRLPGGGGGRRPVGPPARPLAAPRWPGGCHRGSARPGGSPVDQPLVTDAHWLRPSGGVVVERAWRTRWTWAWATRSRSAGGGSRSWAWPGA